MLVSIITIIIGLVIIAVAPEISKRNRRKKGNRKRRVDNDSDIILRQVIYFSGIFITLLGVISFIRIYL